MRINLSGVHCQFRVASKQILIAVMLLGFVAANATADDLVRRWDLDETPYAERNFIAKVGSNVRDGTVGLVDSLVQGVMSAVTLFNFRSGGVALQKVATFGGDVVGLIDNTPATEPVLNGIVSRHLLRFGAGAQSSTQGIAFIHDTKFVDMPEMGPEDYVGDRAFHVRAYGRPSILVSLGGIVVSDFLVRPAGNLLMIFGMRETGESMDQWGKGLIEKSMRVPFL